MKKSKKLVITELSIKYYDAFHQLASYFHLSNSQFLISLMVQSGLIEGGIENFIPDKTAKSEWLDQLVQRQFDWANSQ